MDVSVVGQFLEANPDVKAAAAGVAGFFLRGSATDLWGLGFGDWLAVRRMENLNTLQFKSDERLRAKGILEPKPLPLNLAANLLNAASMEDREELQDLWADLMAAAMDPKRASSIRKAFIDTIKEFDPLDALVFRQIAITMPRVNNFNFENYEISLEEVFSKMGVSRDAFDISLRSLNRLDCVLSKGSRITKAGKVTEYGKELMRVLELINN